MIYKIITAAVLSAALVSPVMAGTQATSAHGATAHSTHSATTSSTHGAKISSTHGAKVSSTHTATAGQISGGHANGVGPNGANRR
jgi:hypothetical protein